MAYWKNVQIEDSVDANSEQSSSPGNSRRRIQVLKMLIVGGRENFGDTRSAVPCSGDREQRSSADRIRLYSVYGALYGVPFPIIK
mmetsp:Transcript_29621/g.114184  ORF Transcript_29621/g.114184 Transcript_29621/m.114184 type:complete len:85 (+) Transcript_29621:192-446(+)